MDTMLHTSPWGVAFSVDPRGCPPVAQFLQKMPSTDRERIGRYLGYLSASGPTLGMPHDRHVRGPLGELRLATHRVVYAQMPKRFVVWHAFRRSTRRTPRDSMDRALRRLDDLLAREERGSEGGGQAVRLPTAPAGDCATGSLERTATVDPACARSSMS